MVNLPNTSTLGIPLNLSSGAGVTSGTFTLQYNSALLDVTGVTVNSTLAGATLTLDPSSSAGTAVLDFTSPTALTSSAVRLGSLQADVPNATAAVYKSKTLLSFTGAELDNGAVAVEGDAAVQVVAYFGDVLGDGTLNSGDAALISRVAVNLDANPGSDTLGGFAAYALADPVILGDVAGSGSVNSTDVTLVNSVVAGIAQLHRFRL